MQILSLKDFEVLPKVYYHTMVSDSKFYASFFDKILDLVDNPGEANGEDAGVDHLPLYMMEKPKTPVKLFQNLFFICFKK